ncbi:sulfate adenylyltransferase subunit 2 [Desulfobaculum xiamenense]|uniref:Sulfate adenylyltransferase subunit 2 n=1 Tax=Desulfobaculum xiamenense TaxID=995050 RepID=A0A846QU54_9BACT|nr:sulfate adenylyltransferase subunit CysD [Desulfobaculum xiamenense]NJB68684.1 sulfate adenylyltransferase subunit 2 [Desulfobaculum xiamenense]
MDRLTRLENDAVYIIREAYARTRATAVLWSMGKDSTVLLWLCMKAFLGRVPIPVIHIDTGYKFPQMYAYRDRWAAEWGLDVRVFACPEGTAVGPDHESKLECCTRRKTNVLRDALGSLGLESVLVGIRRDEHGIRAKERVFSPRGEDFRWDYMNQPAEMWDLYQSRDDAHHLRVHPLLGFTELDVWEYVRRENLELNELYFARNGRRYRSLGCMPCCSPVESDAATVDEIIAELSQSTVGERSGRAQDKEDAFTMQKLRSLGYL